LECLPERQIGTVDGAIAKIADGGTNGVGCRQGGTSVSSGVTQEGTGLYDVTY
jgi:hypothetical protein